MILMHLNRWEIVKKIKNYVKNNSGYYCRYVKTVILEISEFSPNGRSAWHQVMIYWSAENQPFENLRFHKISQFTPLLGYVDESLKIYGLQKIKFFLAKIINSQLFQIEKRYHHSFCSHYPVWGSYSSIFLRQTFCKLLKLIGELEEMQRNMMEYGKIAH